MDKDLSKVLADLDGAEKNHGAFVTRCERQYKAYRGILERRSEAAQWNSKQHPAYILPVIETMTASLLDPNPRFRMRSRPKDMMQAASQLTAADTFERLITYQMDMDDFAQKQYAYIQQGLINDFTVGKVYWKLEDGNVRSRVPVEKTVSAEDGTPLGTYSTMESIVNRETIFDDPTFEVVDVRDFMWHEAARDMQSAKFVAHRVWKTFDELKELEAQGIYKNVDKLKDVQSQSHDHATREQQLANMDRTKDMIEVIEHWTNAGVTVVGNRKVLLKAFTPNPFDHGRKPFVAASGTPDLFRIQGISIVERMEEIQEMLWTVSNQRLDSLALINNVIAVIRNDVDDPDAFEFAPGERWFVDDPKQVTTISPDPTAATVSLQAESMMKGDLQNTTGGMPFLSGTESSSVDQDTATGVSIVTSLAQRVVALRKQHFVWSFKQMGDLWASLNQQFLTEEKMIQVVGPGGDPSFIMVDPSTIQGRFDFTVEMVSDSLMRQEKRAEAQAKLQVAAELAPVMSAIGQPINLGAFLEDYLDAFDIREKERYFAAAPQQGLSQGGPGTPPQEGPTEPTQGVTAPQAADASSPSNATSMNGAQFMQRMLAETGGGANGG